MNTPYTEVIKKDGTVVIFCNFEELLKECYGVSTLKEVESHRKPDGKYICHCPFCKAEGHTKEKLYIKEDFTVGHCFVCGRAYINADDKVKFEFKAPIYVPQFTGLKLVPLQDSTWTLDKFEYDFDDYSESGVKYLEGRHIFMKDLWKPLQFKFWNDNPVAPFKYKNNVFYYQIRFANVTHDSKAPRYFFPPMPEGTKPPYIIEVGDKKKFIICEGVYDAISLLIQAPGYTPFAVLGSSISDYQIQFLREYVPDEILIMMDETSISKKIFNKLISIVDYCPISIIRTYGEDPEEIMKKKIARGEPLDWITNNKTLNL